MNISAKHHPVHKKFPDVTNSKFYPYYYRKVLSKDLQTYYRTNSLLRMVKPLRLEIIYDMDRCHTLWDEFSPYETLFDTWEFRYAFWEAYKHIPYFILLSASEENVGLLPLWREDPNIKYGWFGSEWHEENYFWVKDSLYLPILLSACPAPVNLNAISSDAIHDSDMLHFEPDTVKYYLDLTQINSLDDFTSLLTKKRRYNLKRDHKIISAKKPKIVIDEFKDFETLISLSKKRFVGREDTCFWNNPDEYRVFQQLVQNRSTFNQFSLRMLSVYIDGKIAGVDLIFIYKNFYYPFCCGYDVENFSGIGSYFTITELEDALKLNMKRMDVLEGNYGWKDKYFTSQPLYKYIRML